MNKKCKGMMPLMVRTPQAALANPSLLFSSMAKDLWQSRELARRLFIRDLKGLYRMSFLGYFWIFLPPLATTLAFTFLNSRSLIKFEGIPIPYPAYLILGTLLWQNFADALQAPLRMATQNRSMLIRVQFPREALILSGIYQVLFNFMIRLVLLIPVLIFYKIEFIRTAFLFPLGVIALILMGTAFGLLLTPLGILYKDVETGTTVILGFCMLLTPVVYPPMQEGWGSALTKWNPVTPVLQTARDWLLGSPTSHLSGFYSVTGCMIIALMLGWILYRLALPHVIARIGN
jgi:lipopolysaccharide transport system permease protein